MISKVAFANRDQALPLRRISSVFRRSGFVTTHISRRIRNGACLTVLSLSLLLGLSTGFADQLLSSANAPGDADGAVFGKVKITRSLSAQRMRFRLYPGFKPQAPPSKHKYRTDEFNNVVIYLEPAEEITVLEPALQNPRMIQEGETFIPHVLPVIKGTTVDFPNQDPIFHNVFSLSRTSTFDLGRYPQGERRSVTFDRAGIVPVFCHIHSDMSAVVLVLENHLFTKPDKNGLYEIQPVPPGNYTVVAWHPRSEPVRIPLEVTSGKRVELDLIVPVMDAAGTD